MKSSDFHSFFLFLRAFIFFQMLSSAKTFERITGIYIHIPFCRRRCFYCDFPISVVGERSSTQLSRSQEYTSYLLKEIRQTSKLLHTIPSPQSQIDSIYFGGGTPSLLDDKSNGS
jgi:coproporphyrinogen III oxidase-like Fe-S oxidoreductase